MLNILNVLNNISKTSTSLTQTFQGEQWGKIHDNFLATCNETCVIFASSNNHNYKDKALND